MMHDAPKMNTSDRSLVAIPRSTPLLPGRVAGVERRRFYGDELFRGTSVPLLSLEGASAAQGRSGYWLIV